MKNNFITIKNLEGELKYSQVKPDHRYSITTEEFVIQKPYFTLYFKLKDIIDFHPYDQEVQGLSYISPSSSGYEVTNSVTTGSLYLIRVERAVIHTLSGIKERGKTEVVLQMNDKLRQMMETYEKDIPTKYLH